MSLGTEGMQSARDSNPDEIAGSMREALASDSAFDRLIVGEFEVEEPTPSDSDRPGEEGCEKHILVGVSNFSASSPGDLVDALALPFSLVLSTESDEDHHEKWHVHIKVLDIKMVKEINQCQYLLKIQKSYSESTILLFVAGSKPP